MQHRINLNGGRKGFTGLGYNLSSDFHSIQYVQDKNQGIHFKNSRYNQDIDDERVFISVCDANFLRDPYSQGQVYEYPIQRMSQDVPYYHAPPGLGPSNYRVAFRDEEYTSPRSGYTTPPSFR